MRNTHFTRTEHALNICELRLTYLLSAKKICPTNADPLNPPDEEGTNMQQGALATSPNRLKLNETPGGGGADTAVADRYGLTRTTIKGIAALKAYRSDSGMTWEQLAHFIGISRTALWAWCRTRDPARSIARDHVALILERTGVDIGSRRRRR
jgi:hypothetical protein